MLFSLIWGIYARFGKRMDDFSQLILSLILKGVDEGDMINFLQTLGVSRENLATSSIIQIVNHGISFGDSVNDESMTGELLKRLSQGGNHVKSLSINELKKVLKYLSRIPLEGHDSGKLFKEVCNGAVTYQPALARNSGESITGF